MAAPKEKLKKVEKPEPKIVETPPAPVEKTGSQCDVEGCFEEKAPGQTYVCVKHIRT